MSDSTDSEGAHEGKRRKLNPKFQVKRLTNTDILDFKSWWPQYFKKTGKDVEKKLSFTISKYRHLTYTHALKGYIRASEFIDGFTYGLFNMKKQDNVALPYSKAYNGKVPINAKKLEDVSKILHYIPEEYRTFYDGILTNPTTNRENSDPED